MKKHNPRKGSNIPSAFGGKTMPQPRNTTTIIREKMKATLPGHDEAGKDGETKNDRKDLQRMEVKGNKKNLRKRKKRKKG